MPYNSNKPTNESYIRRVLLGDKSQKDNVNTVSKGERKHDSRIRNQH